MNKKGSALDLVQIAVILLFFSIIILVGYKVTDSLNTEFAGNSEIDSRGRAASETLTGYYPTVIDNSFLLLAVGLSIVALVLAALVKIHPIFLAFYFIVWIIIIFISGVFSNVYAAMAEDPQLIALSQTLLFTNTIMNLLPFIVGIVGGILAVIMYKSWRLSE